MAVELNTIAHEVVVDDSKAVSGAKRATTALEGMANASDQATAAAQKQASGLGILDQAMVKTDRATINGLRALDRWRAAADPAERVAQRLARAEIDLERARRQGLTTEEEKIRILDQLRARMTGTAAANDNFGRAVVAGAASSRQFGNAVQQAGFQVGDFAVQVASGQGVLRPFIQQGSQLLSMFGPWGAVLGAAVAVVGALAVGLGGLGDSAEEVADAAERVEDVFEDVNDALERHQKLGAALKDQQETEIGRVADLARHYRSLTEEMKEFERTQLIVAQIDLHDQTAEIRTQTDAALERLREVAEVVNRVSEQAGASGRGPNAGLVELTRIIDQFNASAQESPEALRQIHSELVNLVANGGPLSKEALENLSGSGTNADLLGNIRESALAAAKALRDPAVQAEELAAKLKLVQQSLDLLNKSPGELGALAALPDAAKATEDFEKKIGKALDRMEKRNISVEQYIQGLEDAAAVEELSGVEKKVQEATLKAQNKLLTEQGKEQRKLYDTEKARIDNAVRTKHALEEQRKAAEKLQKDTERAIEQGTERATENAADLMYEAFTGRIRDIGEFLRNTLLRAVADVTAQMVFRPLIQPVMASAVSFLPQMFGVGTAASGAAGAASGGAGLGGLFNGTGLLSGLSLANGFGLFGNSFSLAGIGQSINNFGVGLGFANTPANFVGPLLPGQTTGFFGSGATLMGTLGAAGLGFAGGSLLASLTGGNAIGGGIGGGLGAGLGFAVGGPLGGVLGGLGGSLLGGLFGGGKSVGPIGHTNIDVSGGRLVVGSTGVDNGADASATIQQAQRAAEFINAIAAQFGLTVTGAGAGAISQGAASGPQSAGAFINSLLRRGGLVGTDARLNSILRGSTADTLAQDVQSFTEIKAIIEGLDVAPFEQALSEVNKHFDELTKKAKEFGFETTKLAQARERELAAVQQQARAPFLQASAGIVGFLQEQRFASLSPSQQLTETQAMFGDLLGRVRGGEVGLTGSLLQTADSLLGLGRQNFASTVNFANLEGFVRTSLLSVAETLSSDEFFDAQVEATKQQTAVQVDAIHEVRDAINDLRREFELMRRAA